MAKGKDDFNQDVDEAIDSWGAAALGIDPLLASFTSIPYAPVRPHVPFYRFLHYPDILDLRKAGYELEKFIPTFDLLEDARYTQALAVHSMLHLHQDNPNPIWNPRRAREIEFNVRAALHRFGIGDVPTLLRRMMGKSFPDESISHLSIDLLNVFFWAALAEVARDYAWRDERMNYWADYLAYPVKAVGFTRWSRTSDSGPAAA
ncbi:MAG: hypothetical protein RIR34_1280 [Actinomycetota bacterium]|jgi:hypothetical protein